MPPPAPAAAAGGGRKRGRAPAATSVGGASQEQQQQQQQPDVGSEPSVLDGVEPAAAASAGKSSKGKLGASFVDFLRAGVGGLAAAVGRSPSASGAAAAAAAGGGVQERKLCGAAQEGVQGKAVAWESPFKSSSGSPEVGWGMGVGVGCIVQRVGD